MHWMLQAYFHLVGVAAVLCLLWVLVSRLRMIARDPADRRLSPLDRLWCRGDYPHTPNEFWAKACRSVVVALSVVVAAGPLLVLLLWLLTPAEPAQTEYDFLLELYDG